MSYRLGNGEEVASSSRNGHAVKRARIEQTSSSSASIAAHAGSRSPIVIDSDDDDPKPNHEALSDNMRLKLTRKIDDLSKEIKSVQEQLEPLQRLYTSLATEKRTLENQLSALSNAPRRTDSSAQTDYLSSSFPWSGAAKSALKSTFGLTQFRLCQEGVINAAMDGRDIVCVMPTGGGKSLTYQLPAIAGARGVTVVISPLLALIWDQVRALREIGVDCAMLTGSTPKEEQNAIYQRIGEGGGKGSKELRMIYVTPEKVSRSKRLLSALEQASAAGRLKRFVIAHCCSQLGHDFRPDYKNLSTLKTLFPKVPIQAVTATLSSKTMPDLLKILRLPPICDGRSANRSGTVFFSAPLFRPNLLYKVIQKPNTTKSVIAKMGKWILDNHPEDSGIIYCFSKKDAESVADSLAEWSNGQIKVGIYHAGVDDWKKEQIHVDWRKGKINCICATIAFGLGIDKSDVRYVIHHSISKSLEGYYQETGRAGRDGKDSDCVLFYRGQDATKLASMVYKDVDGLDKMHEMLRFAQDLITCRKVAFAKYFSTSAQLSAAAWDHADSLAASGGKITTCGTCDNCTRDPTTIVTRNVSLDAWKVLRVLDEVKRLGGRVTLSNVADILRDLGAAGFTVMGGSGGKRKRAEPEKAKLQMNELVGGKIDMSKDDTEALLIHLHLTGYLKESTAYSVNVYVVPGPHSIRLSRLSQQAVEKGTSTAPVIECTFPNHAVKSSKPQKKGEKKVVDIGELSDVEEGKPKTTAKRGKGKAKKENTWKGEGGQACEDQEEPSDPDDDDDDEEEDVGPISEVEFMEMLGPPPEEYQEDTEDERYGEVEGILESSDEENGWKMRKGPGERVRKGTRGAFHLSD